MIRFHRRAFLASLGLTAGGALLPGIATKLVSSAYGQQISQKCVVFWFIGGSIQIQQGQTGWGLCPPEFAAGEAGVGGENALGGSTAFTWPKKLEPLAGLRNKVAIVDGLNNLTPGASAHGSGFQATTCSPGNNSPGGPSIDQAIAQQIGTQSALSSILVGNNKDSIQLKLERTADSFAAAKGSPVPHTTSVPLLMRELFGTGLSGGKPPSPKPIMDSLRLDIKRLESRLAPEERGALNDYLRLVEQFETQQAARDKIVCATPVAPAASSPEEMATAMTQAITLAFQCGISPVAAIAIGTGTGHEDMPQYSAITGDPDFDGHSFVYEYSRQAGLIQRFHMGLIAEMHKALGDSLLTVYTCDSGMAPSEGEAGKVFTHHAMNSRVPAIVVGDLGGALKTGGRYLRYGVKVGADHTNGAPNFHSIADLFLSVAHAMGAPLKTFGGPQQVVPTAGPLAELMA